jgi:ADP-ribosylglycohydrolase
MQAHDRIRAAWQGLLTGDKIGGPYAMARQLAQSLSECGRFVPEDVLRRYQAWYYREGFDTGRVAAMVFDRMREMSNEEAVIAVDRELGGLTAGCNAAHRALPLALAIEEVPDDQLERCAAAEARLTHLHPLAAETSIAYLKIIRQLIRGEVDLDLVFQRAAGGRAAEVQEALLNPEARPLDVGGFAPEALRAAVHFLRTAKSFDDAIRSACLFAGADNYCPVLVGPMGGAHWEISIRPPRAKVGAGGTAA